jgi:hypothetical protein
MQKSSAGLLPRPESEAKLPPLGKTAMQEKLRAVGNYIEKIEALITEFSRSVDLRIELDGLSGQGTAALAIMHEEMAKFFTRLVPPTHIEKDLELFRSKLGLQNSEALFKEAYQKLQSLMAPNQTAEILRAGIIESKGIIVEAINKAIDPARAFRQQLLADSDRPVEGPRYTVKNEANRYEIDEGNIRKWCENEGQLLYGCKKVGGAWQIPESAEEHFPKTWRKREAQPNPKPPMLLWRCVDPNCEYEMRQQDKPTECAECHRTSMIQVREPLNPSGAR